MLCPARFFHKVQMELLTAFKEEFFLLENQICTIEQCLHQGNMALLDTTSQEASKYAALTQNVNASQDGKLDFSLDFLQKLALGIATPVLLPVAIGGSVVFIFLKG